MHRRPNAAIITPGATKYFEAIEPKLYRYPAIDAASFRRAVMEVAKRR